MEKNPTSKLFPIGIFGEPESFTRRESPADRSVRTTRAPETWQFRRLHPRGPADRFLVTLGLPYPGFRHWTVNERVWIRASDSMPVERVES